MLTFKALQQVARMQSQLGERTLPSLKLREKALKQAYEAGKAEGRRLERRRLKKALSRVFIRFMGRGPIYPMVMGGQVLMAIEDAFLISTKPAKLKEGGR